MRTFFKRFLVMNLVVTMMLTISLPILADGVQNTKVTQVLDEPVDWAKKEVGEAISKQLIPVDLQNNYGQSITREEFCILAVQLIEAKSEMAIGDYLNKRGMIMAGSATFTDTANPAILAAKTLGITDGTSPTTFDPKEEITREQAAKFLSATARAVGKDITATTPIYADLDEIAEWAKPYTGYVYNIEVMKGVGGNRFNPKGDYQRQQAFMTMNRLFDSIDVVSMAMVEEGPATEDMSVIMAIKADIEALVLPSSFLAIISGDEVDGERDAAYDLAYDYYYRDGNRRVDTYMYDREVENQIYSQQEDATYSHYMAYTDYGEYKPGNLLPIDVLDVAYLEKLAGESEAGTFMAEYVTYDGEETLYIKSGIEGGGTLEVWYSMTYLMPVKLDKRWLVGTELSETHLSLVLVDPSAEISEDRFLIPEDVELVQDSSEAYWNDRLSGD